MRNIFFRGRIRSLALIGALLCAGTLRAADVKVVTSGAFTAAYLELAPEYERATHNKLVTEFGPSLGTTHNAIPVRLDRNEAIDVVIMAAPGLEALIKKGQIPVPGQEPKQQAQPADSSLGH